MLRREAHLLVTTFLLMRAGHIHELDKKEDIAYLEDRLMPGKTEEEAAKRFEELVFVCLNAKSRLFDDAAHHLNK